MTENQYLYQPAPWVSFLQGSDAKAVQQVVWSVSFSFRACDFLSVNTASKFLQGKDVKGFQAQAEKSNKYLGHGNNLFTHFYEHLKTGYMKGKKEKNLNKSTCLQCPSQFSHFCFSIKDSIWTKSLKDEEPESKETFADQLIPPASQVLGQDFPVGQTSLADTTTDWYWPFEHSYAVWS